MLDRAGSFPALTIANRVLIQGTELIFCAEDTIQQLVTVLFNHPRITITWTDSASSTLPNVELRPHLESPVLQRVGIKHLVKPGEVVATVRQ